MINKQVVTSLNRITVPTGRKDVMLHNILQQADKERTIFEKEQEMNSYIGLKRMTEPKGKANKKAKLRLLATAACLLLVITLIACIPEARAEVITWFKQIFSIQSYIGEESSDRQPEPSLDNLIIKIDNSNRIVTINDIYDNDHARALATNFGITLDEIIYTGNAVYINGWLHGTAGKFLLDQYTGGNTWTSGGRWTEGAMCLTLQSGDAYYSDLHVNFTAEMDGIVQQALNDNLDKPLGLYSENELISSNPEADTLWNEYLRNHDVRFVCQFSAEQGSSLELPDQSIASLEFVQKTKAAKDDSEIILFVADLGSVCIDAERYNSTLITNSIERESVTLQGVQRMFVIEHNFVGVNQPCVKYSVHDLDMSDVSITAETLSFSPTGLQFTLRLDLPESWTREERIAAICGNEYSGLGFQVLLDGEILPSYMYQSSVTKQILGNASDPFITASLSFSDFSITPSEWDSIKAITLIPYTACPLELTLVKIVDEQQIDRKIVLQPGAVITQDAMDGSQDTVIWDDCQMDIMRNFAITINLDNYR